MSGEALAVNLRDCPEELAASGYARWATVDDVPYSVAYSGGEYLLLDAKGTRAAGPYPSMKVLTERGAADVRARLRKLEQQRAKRRAAREVDDG